MELSGKTIAITGIGGFIGLRTVERARDRGMKVAGLDRSPAAAARAEKLGARVVVGDVLDETSVRKAVEGADIVLHTAAMMEEDGPIDAFRRVNVQGTSIVANAAREAGVKRFVHISSVMVYGFRFPPDVPEDGPLDGNGNPYCQTKIESEEVVLPMHGKGMDVLVIRPGDVYGPGSVPWIVRPLQMMKKGLFMHVDGGRGIMNHVHVDNLIDGIFLALEKDVAGEPFAITDDARTTFAEFFGYHARMVGRKRIPSIPAGVAKKLFWFVETGAAMLKKQPPARAAAVDFISRKNAYSINKAKTKLGYTPRISLDEGMQQIETWAKSEGLI